MIIHLITEDSFRFHGISDQDYLMHVGQCSVFRGESLVLSGGEKLDLQWHKWLSSSPSLESFKRDFVVSPGLALWWLTRASERAPGYSFHAHLKAMLLINQLRQPMNNVWVVLPSKRDIRFWRGWLASKFPKATFVGHDSGALHHMREWVALAYRSWRELIIQAKFHWHVSTKISSKAQVSRKGDILCLYQCQREGHELVGKDPYVDPMVEYLSERYQVDCLHLFGRKLLKPDRLAQLGEQLPGGVADTVYPQLSVSHSMFITLIFRWVKQWLRLIWRKAMGQPYDFNGGNISTLLFDELADTLATRFLSLSYFQAAFSQLLDKKQYKYILYYNQFFAVGRMVTASVHKGTQAIGFQHGVVPRGQWSYAYGSHEISSLPAFATDFVSCCPVPDLFLVYGQRMMEEMTSFGYPISKLRIAGSCRHQDFFSPSRRVELERRKANVTASYGYSHNQRILGVFGQWSESTAAWCTWIIPAALSCGWKVVVKPHPRYIDNTSQLMFEYLPSAKESVDIFTGPLEDFFALVTLGVGHSSTTLLESISLGIPTACIIDASAPLDNSMYSCSKAFFPVSDSADVACFLESFATREGDYWKHFSEEAATFCAYHFENSRSNFFENLSDVLT